MQFPPKPAPKIEPLSREEVVEYLISISSQGLTVLSDHDDYVIPIEGGEAKISQIGESWRVGYTKFKVLSTLGDASNRTELDKLLRLAVGSSSTWPNQPTKGRLIAEKPASNLRTISRLIGSGEVQAIFDTYLDNEGLENLCHILSFGKGSVANDIRLLATTATTKGSVGKPARFSKAGVDAWAAQLGIAAEVRVLRQGKEHRRFLLLSGGRTLILGPSLNSLHKNEAVAIEDDTDDRAFFDQQWQTATPLQ